MSRHTLTVLSTIGAGIISIYLGAALNMEGYLGIVFSIAAAGGHIVKAIEDKK